MKAFFRSAPVVTVLGWLIWAWMALVGRTVRWTVEGERETRSELAERYAPGVVATSWHETIMLLPSGWRHYARHWPERRGRVAMMISLSADGEPVARAIRHLDLDAIRGSAGNRKKADKDKGGLRAIAEAAGRLREGGYVCMTPDGPRGPRRIASAGAVTLAQRSGAVLVPYAITSRPAIRLNSWDRFMIPMPFGRGAIVFGGVIDAPRETDPKALQAALQRGMESAMGRAEALIGLAPAPRPPE
ncbi:lysophospholipid acyltransferase family protein [Hyphomonas sp.]|uniref:lysophospholipid acyltransferase family protein n=1 Tax=Hyphomonas sp. TaxID=87 RepID=UPI00391DA109